jgi:hypothetical protein
MFKDQTGHNYTKNQTEPHRTEISVFLVSVSVSASAQFSDRSRLRFESATEPLNRGTELPASTPVPQPQHVFFYLFF